MSPLAPDIAAHIRTELAPVLDPPEARTRLLTVCAQILLAQHRVDFYAELAGPVRDQLARLQPRWHTGAGGQTAGEVV